MSKNKSGSFKRAALAAGISLLASGCGGEESEGPLCDGSEGLVFRAFYAGGGPDLPGPDLQTENGFTSFAVDGQCRYFIGGGWQANASGGFDEGWREGTLDDELALSLQRSIGGADLSGLGACTGYVPLLDASSLYISSADSAYTCGDGNEPARAVAATIRENAAALRTQGQPLAGDLYIKVIEGANADLALSWPSAIPLPEVDPENEASQRAVISAADAAPVRALRELWLQGSATRVYSETGIPVRSGERLVRVFLRDALPHEDESGRLPLPSAQ